MSASKLAEYDFADGLEFGAKWLSLCRLLNLSPKSNTPGAVRDEMALRVFEETRERAAKIAADAIAPNRRDIAEAIRAMQPEPK